VRTHAPAATVGGFASVPFRLTSVGPQPTATPLAVTQKGKAILLTIL
jgi:hypothetical protein